MFLARDIYVCVCVLSQFSSSQNQAPSHSEVQAKTSVFSNVQRSSSGRPGIHFRGRLRQQPHTNLSSRWDIPTGIRMLGIRRRGVQGTGGDRCHVQWQHFGMRQRESSHTSLLNAPATNRFVTRALPKL